MKLSIASILRPAALAAVAILGFAALSGEAVRAQTCGGDYVIKEGESLSQIAARVYGNPAQWTAIFYANQDRLGANATMLVPGLAIRLPCIGGATPNAAAPQTTAPQAAAPAAAEGSMLLSSMVKRIEFLTADGYAPYTGRALEGGGMLTQVMTAAMDLVKEEAKGRFDYGISWVNDWAAHLNPLLTTRAFDMGFPWARPNCENPNDLDQNGTFRCQKFLFSDTLFEVVTLVYVRNDSRIKALKSDEIVGTTICRPSGYPTSDFDQNGRRWLKDGKITLMRPQAVDECFRLLMAGTVDGVAIAELVGRGSVTSQGLEGKVRVLDPPLTLAPLHVIISKSHPNARTMMYYVNTALAKLRENGEYDRIVDRHLNRYLESLAAPPTAAIGSTPATAPRAGTPAATAPAPAPATATTPATAPSNGTPTKAAPTATAKTEPAK